MKFYILASGSKGNACVIKTNQTTIMIDCGYKYRYMHQQLQKYDLNVEALLITHDHSDHIKFLNKFRHLKTYSPILVDVDDLVLVNAYDRIKINDLTITVLPLSHDSGNTVGYLIESVNSSLVYICDTGYVSSQVQNLIHNKDYYIFESNHDIEMLMDSNRSMFLKQRIAGDKGHLCNEDCANVLANVVGLNTKAVYLAHLSEEVNTEELAFTTTSNVLPKYIDIHVAKQHECVVGGNHD